MIYLLYRYVLLLFKIILPKKDLNLVGILNNDGRGNFKKHFEIQQFNNLRGYIKH